ncbi:hypothetical protein TIFTF001_035588 [Ficus carica]|uniref:Uncharacterized protein n=1 Tax=Ficus carica TaxID=3494 RepID=A0AA88E2J0_FICCA|nr:hypothetical protein TIFTF001_035588 [Ficus carica]
MTEVEDCSNILHMGSTADPSGGLFQGQIWVWGASAMAVLQEVVAAGCTEVGILG